MKLITLMPSLLLLLTATAIHAHYSRTGSSQSEEDFQVYGQSVISLDGTVEKSLAAVIRVPREQPTNEMPNDEPDTSPPSSGPAKTVRGIVGFSAELLCDVEPKVPDDQLQLVLWYKKGHKSPIYTFDARDKSLLTYASHFSPIYGQRASMRLPNGLSQSKHMAVLVLSHLRPEDEGVYKCRADFKRSPTKNNRMFLSILQPPKKPIIHDANGRKMTSTLGPYKVGEDLVATCVTSADDPPPALTWWRDQALIDDTYEVINNETTNILMIPQIQRTDLDAIFTCQAVSPQLDIPVSTQLKLDLTFPPLSVQMMGDRKKALQAGKESSVECRCQGSRPSPLFRWFIGDRELDLGLDKMTLHHQTTENKEEWSSSVIKFIPKAEDNGKYLVCKAANEYYPSNIKEDGYIINVHYVPLAVVTFGRSLNPKNILEGADVYFECHVKSNPPFYNITWRNNGKFLIENVSKGVIVGNQTLALQKVTREDAGLYTCVASNSEGDGESNAQYLDIKFAPECKQNQRIVYGAAFKSEIMVNCYVEANPMPHSFKWQFKTASKRRRTDLINTVGGAKALDEIKDMVDLPSNQYSLEYDHSLLRYRTMTEADYGYLYCWAENLAGPQREPCRFEVVRESPPDPPIYCQPLNVTWEHIEVTCQPGFDGGHLPSYHCEVFKNQELAFNLTSQEAPSFGLPNLEAGADYHVVVYASNDLGSSPKVAFNASTLNLAEKRTAETRSKLSPIMNDPKELDVQDHIKVDPGLALLPIVAILCGVAIGLGTVALGVILMVRGRHAAGGADRNEDGLGDLASGDEASIKRYDAVCAASSSSSEVDLRPQSTVVVGHHHHHPGAGGSGNAGGGVKEHRFRGVPAGCEREYLQQQPGGGCGYNCPGFNSASGSLSRVHQHHSHHHHGQRQHPQPPAASSSSSDLSSLHRNSLGRQQQRPVLAASAAVASTHIHHHSGPSGGQCLNESVMRRSTSSSTSTSGSRHNTLQRSVRFEEVMASHHHRGQPSETDGLLDETMPLPQPPATFSDPPQQPPSSDDQQLLRIRAAAEANEAAANAGQAAADNSSQQQQQFVTFCPPNMEPKKVVNATRL